MAWRLIWSGFRLFLFLLLEPWGASSLSNVSFDICQRKPQKQNDTRVTCLSQHCLLVMTENSRLVLVQVSGVEEGNGGSIYFHALLSASCFDCTVRTHICVCGDSGQTLTLRFQVIKTHF